MTAPRPALYVPQISDEIWDALRALPRSSQRDDAVNFLMGYATHTPTTRIPGKLKMLRHTYNGVWQYDLGDGYRIEYTVDEAAKTVNVERVGPHRDWRQERSRRR